MQPIQTLALQNELLRVRLTARSRFLNFFPCSFIKISNMLLIPALVDCKIVGHREKPRLWVVEGTIIAKMLEKTKKSLLHEVLSSPRIPGLPQQVPEHRNVKLFEQSMYSFGDRHRAGRTIRSQRQHLLGKRSLRGLAEVEHPFHLITCAEVDFVCWPSDFS